MFDSNINFKVKIKLEKLEKLEKSKNIIKLSDIDYVKNFRFKRYIIYLFENIILKCFSLNLINNENSWDYFL
jgi:hypothetical protein